MGPKHTKLATVSILCGMIFFPQNHNNLFFKTVVLYRIYSRGILPAAWKHKCFETLYVQWLDCASFTNALLNYVV